MFFFSVSIYSELIWIGAGTCVFALDSLYPPKKNKVWTNLWTSAFEPTETPVQHLQDLVRRWAGQQSWMRLTNCVQWEVSSTLSRFGGLQGRFVDLAGGKGEFHLKSAQAVRLKSCQTERNCLQVTTEANMHIPYIHISESVFFLLLFSPVVCGCCGLCILGICFCVFVAFVCFLGSSVVWLLVFVGYLAAWLLVFFTCPWAHSWRHVAYLDRNNIFDIFGSWLCGFCIASLADVVFLRQWWFDLRIVVSWIICFF